MQEYRKALSEVYEIIQYMPEELKSKIPNKFKKIIEQEKEQDYRPEVNNLVMKNNLLPETIVMLGLIYRDFLCSQEEREKLQLQDNEDYQQQMEKEALNYENLFPKRVEIEKEELHLVEVKKKWYEKVMGFFRRIIKGEE